MDNQWYYKVLGRENGPVSRDQLAALVDKGTLSPLDQVRAAGGETFQSVQSALKTADAQPPAVAPAPATPPRPMNQSNYGPSVYRSGPPGGAVPQAENVGDPTSTEGAQNTPEEGSAPVVKEEREDRFFLRSGQTIIGPLSPADLCRMAEAGKIVADDFIRRNHELGWKPASEVPEVMAAVLVATDPIPPEPEGFVQSGHQMPPQPMSPPSAGQPSAVPVQQPMGHGQLPPTMQPQPTTPQQQPTAPQPIIQQQAIPQQTPPQFPQQPVAQHQPHQPVQPEASGAHPIAPVPPMEASVPAPVEQQTAADEPRRRRRRNDDEARPRKKKGKRKQSAKAIAAAKKEEELEGIFDEVFGPGGTLEQRDAAVAAAPAQGIVPGSVQPMPQPGMAAAQPAMPMQQPGMPVTQQPGMPMQQPGVPMQQPGMPNPGMPGMAATNPAAVQPQPTPGGGANSQMAAAMTAAYAQAASPKPKKKRSGPLISAGALKIVGIVAAVVAVVAIAPMLISFGPSVPDSSEVETGLAELADKYDDVSGSAAAWKEFASEVRATAGAWVTGYRKTPGKRSPREMQLQKAATALIQLANSKHDDTEKHKQLLDRYETSLKGEKG